MTITPAKLTRAAGFSALVAGLLYMFVQIIHPHEDVTQVVTTGWAVTHILTLLMAVALAVGITGIYLRQVREMGVLGLIGYLLYAAWSVLVISWTFVEAFVLPSWPTRRRATSTTRSPSSPAARSAAASAR